jgi:acyl-CoA thioesterase I
VAIGLFLFAVQGEAAAQNGTILVLGDSLSAAYGMKPEQGWVSLLQKRLQAQGYGYRVVNTSVSGETTSGGLQRLPRALNLHKPQIVIIELGGNDGLRGLPVSTTRQNLMKMVELSKAAGAEVVLAGMQMPPNYGPRYTKEFANAFGEVAERHKTVLVPFLLDKVAFEPGMMQEDGLHPTARAQPIVVDNLWPLLVPLLRKD